MEKHIQRFLVHAVVVRDVGAFQWRARADADHDPGQPQGGTILRVLLQPTWI